jgi:hypothetical protein
MICLVYIITCVLYNNYLYYKDTKLIDNYQKLATEYKITGDKYQFLYIMATSIRDKVSEFPKSLLEDEWGKEVDNFNEKQLELSKKSSLIYAVLGRKSSDSLNIWWYKK